MIIFICTGCVSTSIYESLALIEQEDNVENNKTVNKRVLTSIHALLISKKVAEQHHTFTYKVNNTELNYNDKTKLTSLVAKQNQNITITIALAKGTNKLDQLALSMTRAKVLRLYISHFNNKVTIKFSPKLSTDTINLVIGA